jgi:hypothetical protein
MDAAGFRDCLQVIGWTQRGLGLSRSNQTAARCGAGPPATL